CDPAWNSVSKELTHKFFDKTRREWNPGSRAVIRLIFHDCGTWDKYQELKGGCDGSLLLSPEELGCNENKGIEDISAYVKGIAEKYRPPDPRVKIWIGRQDSSVPAPDGGPLDINAPAKDFWNIFKAKGFDERDLAALLGLQPQINCSSKYHSSILDVKYHKETSTKPNSIVVFRSDEKLAKFGHVGEEFLAFIDNQGKCNEEFEDA
ncbi:heme peroxidase, partial [Lojkania enalia]